VEKHHVSRSDAPELRQTLGGVDIFHRVGVEEGIDRLD
jgi:hypothetical protein